jgi:hypothetical protein
VTVIARFIGVMITGKTTTVGARAAMAFAARTLTLQRRGVNVVDHATRPAPGKPRPSAV